MVAFIALRLRGKVLLYGSLQDACRTNSQNSVRRITPQLKRSGSRLEYLVNYMWGPLYVAVNNREFGSLSSDDNYTLQLQQQLKAMVLVVAMSDAALLTRVCHKPSPCGAIIIPWLCRLTHVTDRPCLAYFTIKS
jgi:hypothetical protein